MSQIERKACLSNDPSQQRREQRRTFQLKLDQMWLCEHFSSVETFRPQLSHSRGSVLLSVLSLQRIFKAPTQNAIRTQTQVRWTMNDEQSKHILAFLMRCLFVQKLWHIFLPHALILGDCKCMPEWLFNYSITVNSIKENRSFGYFLWLLFLWLCIKNMGNWNAITYRKI